MIVTLLWILNWIVVFGMLTWYSISLNKCHDIIEEWIKKAVKLEIEVELLRNGIADQLFDNIKKEYDRKSENINNKTPKDRSLSAVDRKDE